MATYKGKTVKLNNPRRISKGETSYGKKKSVVCKRRRQGKARDLWRSEYDYQKKLRRAADLTLDRAIIVITPVLRRKLGTGHVRRGEYG